MIFSDYFFRLLFFSIILMFATQSNISGNTLTHDSLKRIIESEDSPDTLLFEAYHKLSWELKSSVPNQALEYANEALTIAERLNRPSKVADALSYIGVIYWQMGDFSMALDYHLEANGIYEEIQDHKGIARSNTNLGIIFSSQSHYDRALENYFKALTLYEEIDNKEGMAVVLNNIGMVYSHQRDYDIAERYHLQSLELKQSENDPKGMAFSYNNLGRVYQGKNEPEKARDFYFKALDIRRELADKREIANTTENLGYLSFLLDEYEEAERYLQEALELYNEVDDKSGLAKTLNSLGKLYHQKGDGVSARNYFNQSLRLAQDIGSNRLVMENYGNISEVLASTGDYQTAYRFQQEYNEIRDSIYNEESRRKIYELQFLYDREQKESEVQLLRKNEQINLLSSQRDRLLRNFLIVGVIMVLVSLFLLYNRFLILRNSNILLEKQKEEISESNAQLVELNHSLMEQKKMYEELNHKLNISNKKLKESEKNLMEINATKDKFFSIISHDLRNPFASIVSFSRILKRDILNMSKDELSELALELDKSVLKIDNLLENLLQWSRTQTGKIKYRPEYIALHEIIKDNVNLVLNNARDKNIKLNDSVDDDLAVWADRNMTDTVIRNLLSNALKYTDQGGEIVLSSYVKNHKAYISVKDNGVGIPEENKKKIFQTDSLHSTYGTMDEKGSGLGLLLCKEFVEKQGGEIFFESKKGEGSVFTFSLPCEQL
ncbi:MAG: tetratricopeptide repeat protein [Bacteroidales bacterium]